MALAYDDTSPAVTEPWIPLDTFGARLALVRQAKQLNVKDAAKACGISNQSWRNWEAGASPRGMNEVARKIADALHVDYTWLMAGGPIRSRWFAPLSLVPDSTGEQMVLALDIDAPTLSPVPG